MHTPDGPRLLAGSGKLMNHGSHPPRRARIFLLHRNEDSRWGDTEAQREPLEVDRWTGSTWNAAIDVHVALAGRAPGSMRISGSRPREHAEFSVLVSMKVVRRLPRRFLCVSVPLW